MVPGSFSDEARHGHYYYVRCQACRREVHVSARSIVASGRGDQQMVNSHWRWRCTGCGVRGKIWMQVLGYWTGPASMRPSDWVDGVDERMPKSGE